jgi:hypothetical protein
MIRASLCWSLFLLSVGSTSYAADSTQRKLFCTFHSEECEAEKIAKPGMKSVCWFHKDHAKDMQITPVRYPDSATWHDTSNEHSDKISADGYIAELKKIPYCYEEIKKQPNLNAYVLKCEYEPLRDAALVYLGKKEIEFAGGYLDLEENPVLKRIQYYVSVLKTSITYKHKCCIGLIVPKRAVMVALQWAHFADDHTDKSKEELKKMLPEDDELVALCSELDKLVVQPKNNSEIGGSSESFDPRRETEAQYQLRQDKKYDPCGW